MDNDIFTPALVSHSARSTDDTSFGRILLDMGKITPESIERVLRLQKDKGQRFGEVAKQLGLISEADIRQVLSQQFDYPYLQAGQGNFDPLLVAAYQPFSKEVEALRALRSQLALRWFGEGHKALAIVSVNAGDGCSRTAANLALVFSQLGERTLLVDANLRAPFQHKIFNVKESRGLSDILAGRAGMEVAARVESFESLSVLGGGTVPPNPQELLGRSTFVDFMNTAMNQYDIIIVDTPPATESSDAQTVTARCRGGLLVSRLNHTRMADLQNVKEQITVSGAHIVGAVINDY